MNRLTSKYLARLAFAALPLVVACDSPIDVAVADVDASMSRASASDVLVVRFETRAPERALALVEADIAQVDVDGVYEDAGPVLAATGIALDDASKTQPIDLAGKRWLLNAGRLIVSSAADLDARFGQAPAKLLQSEGTFVAQKDLTTTASETNGLMGQEVKVFDHEREVCVARVVGDFVLEASLVHFIAPWNDAEDPGPIVHTADEVFEAGTTLLTSALEPLMGDCSSGLWAAPVAAPTPTLYREVALDRRLVPRARAAFRQTRAWAQAQAEMEIFFNDADSAAQARRQKWDRLPNMSWISKLYRSQTGSELFVMVGDSWDGCGSEGQRVATVFDVVRNGKRVSLVERVSMHGGDLPAGLVDLEGDGVLEIFAGGGRLGTAIERWHGERQPASDTNEWHDERYEPVHGFEINDVTSYGCPC